MPFNVYLKSKILLISSFSASVYLWWMVYRCFFPKKKLITECDWYKDNVANGKYEELDLEDASATLGFTQIFVSVPSYAVGAIIGKKGSVIKSLQENHKCFIKFVDAESTDNSNIKNMSVEDDSIIKLTNNVVATTESGVAENTFETLVIRGPSWKVKEAENEILDIISAVPCKVDDVLFVEDCYIGLIIGKQGSNINRLRRAYQVNIDIDHGKEFSDIEKSLKRICINGLLNNVAAAKDDILSAIKEREQRDEKYPKHRLYNNFINHENVKIVDEYANRKNGKEREGPSNQNNANSSLSTSSLNDDEKCIEKKNHIKISHLSRLTFPSLNNNEGTDVIVKSVVDCKYFSIHTVSSQSTALDLKYLTKQMTNCYNDIPFNARENYKVGDVVAAFFASENTWQRAVVIVGNDDAISFNIDDMIEIDYIDYGDSDRISLKCIRPLFFKFVNLPIQSIQCVLHDVKPISTEKEWSEDAIIYFEEISGCHDESIIQAFLMGHEENSNRPILRLINNAFIDSTNQFTDLANELKRMSFAA